MPSPSFYALSQQLLDAGIAPKFAERLRRELEDHYRDLEREALANERSPFAAELEARRRLGTNEMIAQEFLTRPELKSWIYRSRWFVHVLRGVCIVYLSLRAAWRAAAAYRAGFARFAAASLAAVALTVALLLGLELSIDTAPPAGVRAHEAVQTVVVSEPARAQAERIVNEVVERAPPPARARWPGFEPPDVPLPHLPSPELGARPIVAVDIETTPAIPRMTPVDADLLPIFRVTPQFPTMAAARGIEGYVLIEYTVTRTGSVSDIVVVESSSELFERPALEAVEKFKYRPRIVDGSPVPVHGVRTRMRFVLEA